MNDSSVAMIPLAERMRPKQLNEFIGHSAVLGTNSPLMSAIKKKQLFSFILWGPPGVGKTSIAKIIANVCHARFEQLSAVSAGVKDLREISERASLNRRQFNEQTLLFIDEIHRFNKSQQDALLHDVESGLITLIGASTENPSFELNPALLSRLRVYRLDNLGNSDLVSIIENALQNDLILKQMKIEIENIAVLVDLAGGDARKCLNILEMALSQATVKKDTYFISADAISHAAENQVLPYDKKSDYHYDTISAFIKSVRGSDPDAALVWLARMLSAGETPEFIARRCIILASEDIGNADPSALSLAVATFEAVRILGMPEARIVLAQCATYLAATVKSNASYLAIDSAISEVKKHSKITVPLHLRNAVTPLMKKENYGKDYLYAHDFPQHFVKQNYFPKEILEKTFYFPSDNGREKNIKDRLTAMWGRIESDENNQK